jgi:hypothetical protein
LLVHQKLNIYLDVAFNQQFKDGFLALNYAWNILTNIQILSEIYREMIML